MSKEFENLNLSREKLEAFKVLDQGMKLNNKALNEVMKLDIDRELKASLVLTVLMGG